MGKPLRGGAIRHQIEAGKLLAVGLVCVVLVGLNVALIAGPWEFAVAHAADGRSLVTPQDASDIPRQQSEDDDPEANLPYLFAVFSIAWAAFFAYVFFVSQRQREMRRDIQALKKALDEKERQASEIETSRESQDS